MDGTEFAEQLGAWISPGILAQAAGELRDDPQASEERIQFYLGSQVLRSAEEAGLADLVQLYLDHFFLPESVLQIARLFWKSYFTDSEIVSRVRKARFHGALHRTFPTPPQETPTAPLLMVECSCFEFRLVDKPVTMLVRLISDLAQPFRRIRERNPNAGAFHQELTHDGPLAVYVESRVGQAYGLWRFGRAGMAESTFQIRSTPRRRSFYGPGPVDAATLSTIQIMAELEEERLPETYPDHWYEA